MKKGAFPLLWISAAAFCGLLTQKEPGEIRRIAVQTVLFALAAGVFLFIKRDRLDLAYIRCKEKNDIGYSVFAGVVLAVCVPFFHKTWAWSDAVYVVADRLGISSEWFLTGVPMVLAALSYPAVVYFLKAFLRDWLDIRHTVWEKYKYLCKPALLLAGIYCFSILAILRADYIYKDDMQRLIGGITYYGRESRFVGEFATFFLHFDEFFADTSPLPQISEMVLMAFGVMIVYSLLAPERKPSFFAYCAMVPFALTPYFLECVSFKYDPPQHALAFLFSVIPFLFLDGDRKKYLTVTVLCVPLLCMSHQVAMAFYPSMVVLVCFLRWLQGRWQFWETAVYTGQSAVAYIVGLLIYRFGIMRIMPSGLSGASTEVLSLRDLFPGIIQNYRDFFSRIYDDFNTLWIAAIGVLCLSFVFCLVEISKRKKGVSFVAGSACLLLLLLLSFSLYPILKYPLYSPRHMYSFGYFIGLIALTAATFIKPKILVPKIALVLLSASFIVFSFTYGNALEQQKIYTEYRMESVLETLTEITSEHPDETYIVQIKGNTGYAPTIDAMPESLQMIRRLVTIPFGEYYAKWWACGIHMYYGLNIDWWNSDAEPDYSAMNLPLYMQNYYYSVYTEGNKIVVVLEDRP